MDEKNHGRSNDVEQDNHNRQARDIGKNSTKEQEVIQTLEKNDGLSWEEDEIVYMEWRMYVPNNKKLKEKILQENYDSVDVRYPGQQRMLELIKQNY